MAAVTVSLIPQFQVAAYRGMRAGVFAGLGLWGSVPMMHVALTYGHVHALQSALRLDLCMGALYLVRTIQLKCA